jgi:hypothetical protein
MKRYGRSNPTNSSSDNPNASCRHYSNNSIKAIASRSKLIARTTGADREIVTILTGRWTRHASMRSDAVDYFL